MSEARARRDSVLRVLVLALLAFLWGGHTTGLVSSNDGSHLALARALALRGETSIDPEMALTLRVDLAERDGHYYSDRPPGTAMLALPAVRVGHALDPGLLERSRAAREMLVAPGVDPYILTYAKRSPGAPPLAGLMGTSLALGVHTVLVGLLGVALVMAIVRRLGAGIEAELLAAGALGLGSLWGPYSTVLFSHVTAGTLLAALWLALLGLEDQGASTRATMVRALLAGLCGAWAIACDYLLLVMVVPMVAIGSVPRRWPLILAGTSPLVAAVLTYHHLAFGHPLAVGYDFQTNFDFARQRGATFGGDPITGVSTLLGLGDGGGLAALSPLLLVALLAGLAAPAWRDPEAPGGRLGRWGLVCAVPWLVLLCLHQTPGGGAGADHRYLVPLLPLLAVMLALAVDRVAADRPAVTGGIALAASVSGLWIWPRFLAWHEGPTLPRPGLGLALAVVAALLGALFAARPLVRNVEGSRES